MELCQDSLTLGDSKTLGIRKLLGTRKLVITFQFFFQIVGQSTKKHTSLIFLPSLSHDLNNAVEVFPSFHRHKMSRSNHPTPSPITKCSNTVSLTPSPHLAVLQSPPLRNKLLIYTTRVRRHRTTRCLHLYWIDTHRVYMPR